MTKKESKSRQIDVLAIGLFGLAVGALTLGLAQLRVIGEADKVGVFVIAMVFGGLVQMQAGLTDIRYNEQLGGTALTMYGFYWLTVFGAELVSESTSFHFDGYLYVPIKLVYLIFSAVMVYLTAFRSVALSLLHFIISLTFLAAVLVGMGQISKDSSRHWAPLYWGIGLLLCRGKSHPSIYGPPHCPIWAALTSSATERRDSFGSAARTGSAEAGNRLRPVMPQTA